jgi:hypothetical protein
MKKAILFLLIILSNLLVSAQSVSQSEAIEIALRFFNERAQIHNPGVQLDASLAGNSIIEHDGRPMLYSVNISGGGYVLVSASKYTFPVLAYSINGQYSGESEPENFKAWMRYFGRQIEYAEELGIASPEVISAREKLADGGSPGFSPKASRVVEPMLRTTWDQGNYYNAMCPLDPGGPGGHCWAGCVATAVGQLMFFHRWPNTGTGSYSYIHPEYGEQYANFGETTYNWNGMETTLNGPNSAIALLLYHLGISFDMDYGPNGSGMWNHSAANSMRNYFKYGPQTQYIFRDTTTMNWDSILITNLDNRKPLYYAGWEGVNSDNGHAFVCDGYAPDNFYHFNWGWGGSSDGYFLLSALTPGGNNFNFAQEVIKDIYPDTLTYSYPEFCNGPDTLITIAGTFSDGSNMVDYNGNNDCFWLIKPAEADFDSISSINLEFPLLDLAENDHIRIYSGADTTAALLAEITGTLPPETLNISGDQFLVRFTSDDTENADGFLAAYKSVLPVYCSGTIIYTDSSGMFDDGSGDKKYNNSAICKWKISPETLVPITLTFEAFNTEAENDVLRIYDLGNQQLIATFSGDTIPDPITIQSGKAYLVFITNKQITAPGWTVSWAPEGTTKAVNLDSQEAGIYPNPVREQLWVKPGKHLGKKTEIIITSVSGAVMLKKQVSLGGNNLQVHTDNLKSGFYIATLSSEAGINSFRFVKL